MVTTYYTKPGLNNVLNVYKVERDYANGPIRRVVNTVTGDVVPVWTQTVEKLQKRSKAFMEVTEEVAKRLTVLNRKLLEKGKR